MKQRNNEGTGRFQWTAELVQENIERFHKYKSEGTLGNNGPKTPGGGTSFSTDRWKSMLEDLAEKAPKQAQIFVNATNMQIGETTEEASVESDFEEFVVDKNELKFIDEPGSESEAKKEKTTSEERISPKGMMSVDDGTEMPADGSYLSIDRASKTMESNKAAITEKYKKINEDLLNEKIAEKNAKEEAERRGAAQDKISGVKEKLSDILTKYDAVAELDKQQAAAAEKKAKEEEEIDGLMGDAEMEQDFMEADSDSNMLDESFSDADLEDRLSGASKSQDAMEADADLRDNPMLSLTDEEKGDFEFKTLEPKDESGQEGISMIMQEAGLDANQAKALYGKLKSMCK